MMLSDVCLSVAYIGPKSSTDRPRKRAAAVGVGTCWPWETAATLPSARRRKALRRPRGRRGAGYIVAAARLQHVIYKENTSHRSKFILCVLEP